MAEPKSQKRNHGGGHHHHGAITEKPKNFKKSVKRLVIYMLEYKFILILTFIFTVTSVALSVIGPKILGNATTLLFEGLVGKYMGTGGIDFSGIGKILGLLIVLYVISMLLGIVQGFFANQISQNVTYKLRREISEKIHRLPFSKFDGENRGEVLSVITNDADSVSNNLGQVLTGFLHSFCTIIGIIIVMFTINWLLAVVIIISVPVSMIFIGIAMSVSQKHFKARQDWLGHVNGQIEEVFASQNIVRAFNAEGKELSAFEEKNNELRRSSQKAEFISGLMMPIMNLIGNISYVFIAALGGYMAFKGQITVGDVQAFIQYAKQFTQPMAQVGQISAVLQTTAAAAERVFDFLELPEEDAENQNQLVSTEKINGNIEFKNVKFGYTEDKIIINNFSANIKKGQKIAIVGHTGAGKTTMVKLLMRFYDLNDGAILIDGENITSYQKQDMRSKFGMVLQDTWAFTGSIRENIRYGRLNATDAEVEEAAKAAYAEHFIRTLEGGYEAELNEETNNISSGQKQLLTIARAILADPKILILDEATSSVDTMTEERIQKAMDNLMSGRTSFVIAHRLSTIKNADLILVMDKGDIVEQGSHNDLLQKNGVYADIYNAQFSESA